MCGKEKNDKDWYEVDGAFLGCYVAFIHIRVKDGIDEVMFQGRLLGKCRCCEECEGGKRKIGMK